MMGSDCPFQFPCSGQMIKYVNWKPFNFYSMIHKSCKFTVENFVLALYPHFHIGYAISTDIYKLNINKLHV